MQPIIVRFDDRVSLRDFLAQKLECGDGKMIDNAQETGNCLKSRAAIMKISLRHPSDTP